MEYLYVNQLIHLPSEVCHCVCVCVIKRLYQHVRVECMLCCSRFFSPGKCVSVLLIQSRLVVGPTACVLIIPMQWRGYYTSTIEIRWRGYYTSTIEIRWRGHYTSTIEIRWTDQAAHQYLLDKTSFFFKYPWWLKGDIFGWRGTFIWL